MSWQNHDRRIVTLSGPQMIVGALIGSGLLTYSLVYGLTEKPSQIDLERAALKSPTAIGKLALCHDQLLIEASQQGQEAYRRLPSAADYKIAAGLSMQLHVSCAEPNNVIATRIKVDQGEGSVTNAQLLPVYYEGK